MTKFEGAMSNMDLDQVVGGALTLTCSLTKDKTGKLHAIVGGISDGQDGAKAGDGIKTVTKTFTVTSDKDALKEQWYSMMRTFRKNYGTVSLFGMDGKPFDFDSALANI